MGFPGARAAAPLPGECSGGRAGGPHTASRPRPAGVSRAALRVWGSVWRLQCMPAHPAFRSRSRAPRVLPLPRLPPFPANAAPPARWLRRWRRRRRRRRRRVSLAPLQSARAKLLAPPPPLFLGLAGGVGGVVHDVTVSVSVPEPEVVVAERAMRRNGGV